MAEPKFTLEKYQLQLRREFTTSKQSTASKDTLLVRYGSGVGEGSSSLHYGPTTEELIPLTDELLRQREPFDDGASVGSFLEELPKYLSSARCGLEMAFLDHQAQERGVPLFEFLDLPRPGELRSSVTITRGSGDELKEQVERFHDFSNFKLKVGFDGDLQFVEDVLKLKEATLRLDANGGWSAEEAIERMRSLSGYPVEFIEQPLDEPTVRELDKLKTKVDCTVLLDESIKKETDIARFAEVVDGISLKLAKCGGLTETVKLATAARDRGLKLLLGCMVETSIGITAGCHIASFFDYLDLDSILLIENDPAWGAQFQGDKLLLPEGPGLGLLREESRFA